MNANREIQIAAQRGPISLVLGVTSQNLQKWIGEGATSLLDPASQKPLALARNVQPNGSADPERQKLTN